MKLYNKRLQELAKRISVAADSLSLSSNSDSGSYQQEDLDLYKLILNWYIKEMKSNEIKQEQYAKWADNFNKICKVLKTKKYFSSQDKINIKTLQDIINDFKIEFIREEKLIKSVEISYKKTQLENDIIKIKYKIDNLKEKQKSKLFKFTVIVVKIFTLGCYDKNEKINERISSNEKEMERLTKY